MDLRTNPHRWPIGEFGDTRERSVAGYQLVYRVDVALRIVTLIRVFGPFQNRDDL